MIRISIAIVFGLSAGCMEGSLTLENEPVSGGGNAQSTFEATVRPILRAQCATNCHEAGASPAFMGSPGESDDYTAVLGAGVHGNFEPNSARMLLEITQGGHYSANYSGENVAAIEAWMEEERTGGGGEVIPTSNGQDPLATWAGCMTLGNFNEYNMGAWAEKEAENGDDCSNCHSGALARFNTAPEPGVMHIYNRTSLLIVGFFTVEVDNHGVGRVIPAYDKLVRMGDGTTLHPTYNVDLENDEDFLNLEAYYQATMALLEAGNCPNSGYASGP